MARWLTGWGVRRRCVLHIGMVVPSLLVYSSQTESKAEEGRRHRRLRACPETDCGKKKKVWYLARLLRGFGAVELFKSYFFLIVAGGLRGNVSTVSGLGSGEWY